MRRAVVGWLVIVLGLGPTGCGTVVNLTRPEPEPVPEAERVGLDGGEYRPVPLQVYGGLKYYFLDPHHEDLKWLVDLRGVSALICWAVEFPLCLVGDTLTLPITIPATLLREDLPPPPAKTGAEGPVTPSSPPAPSPPAPAPPGCPAT